MQHFAGTRRSLVIAVEEGNKVSYIARTIAGAVLMCHYIVYANTHFNSDKLLAAVAG